MFKGIVSAAPWIWGAIIELYKLCKLNSKTTLFCVGVAALAYLLRPSASVANALASFEHGVLAGYGGWRGDANATIPRPLLHKNLIGILRPDSVRDAYAVIIGDHGTGKSTAIRHAARTPGTDGVNGVVYLHVEKISDFEEDLGAAMALQVKELGFHDLLSRFVFGVAKDNAWPTWGKTRRAIQAAASEFLAKHGRPAALVLDNVDVIAREDPKMLITLQRFAKSAADSGSLRVVFVSSDGTAPAIMSAQSEWSRALDTAETEIGDIPDADARVFLTYAGMEQSLAAHVVDRITGGRFALLNTFKNLPNKDAADQKVNQLNAKLDRQLRAIDMPAHHDFFKALVASETKTVLTSIVVATNLSDAMLSQLLHSNIIASHSGETFSFHSRFVQRYFEKKAAAGGAGNG